MPVLFTYLIKLSVSLAVVYLFYRFVLRKLTFYTCNRWYLAGYTILSFIIPFINISPVLERNEWTSNGIISWVPVIGTGKAELINSENILSTIFTSWNTPFILVAVGILVFLIKLLTQLFSFYRMRKKAVALNINGLNIYQVNEDIIPFSFGNSIFINRGLHDENELQEIIRHEFIHVKQKHSLDIIWGELLCLLNWYNPFAWMLKRSIRQNLEFIADNKVIESGIDKKEYQFLLLKVTGNNQYSIATQFNFSSLKKRIAMMNKLKSTRRQLLRMLFLLPATAILLLAFRSKMNSVEKTILLSKNVINPTNKTHLPTDTIPSNELLKEYNEFLKRNPEIKNTEWGTKQSTIIINLKTGEKEIYNFESKDDVEKAEKKYGKLPKPPPPPPSTPTTIQLYKTASPDVKSYNVKNNIVTVMLNNGKKETYNLSIPAEKKAYEKKYGVVEVPVELVKEVRIATTQTVPVNIKAETVTEVRLTEMPVTINSNINAVEAKTVRINSNINATTKIATVSTISVSEVEHPVTVTGYQVNKIASTDPVTVVGYPTTKNASTDPITVTGYQIAASPKETPGMLNLGGLTIQNEGQYILLDGKEPGPEYKGTLKGTYRITFLDKDDAVKKYGDKGKKGAIILETIKPD